MDEIVNREVSKPMFSKKKIFFGVALGVFLVVGVFLLTYSNVRDIDFGVNIDDYYVSEDLIFIQLSAGVNEGNISAIRFIFRDAEGVNYTYETSEGVKNISVPYKRFFFWKGFRGTYSYSINATDVGLENFNDVEAIEVVFIFQRNEDGELVVSETNPLGTTLINSSKSTLLSSGSTGPDSGNRNSDTGGCVVNNLTYLASCHDNDVYWHDNCGGLGSVIGNCLGSQDCFDGGCRELGNAISQYDITWFFDKNISTDGREGTYRYGTFVNGDYWVKTDDVSGVVNIVRMTPESIEYETVSERGCELKEDCPSIDSGESYGGSFQYDCVNGFCVYSDWINGWEVNPAEFSNQAFDSRFTNFLLDLTNETPYLARANESVVKSISNLKPGMVCGYNDKHVCPLHVAAVLTVLGEIPLDNGQGVFRPPYFGYEKTMYYVDDINTDLIPSYEPPKESMPTLEWLEDRYQKVQLDHKLGYLGRHMHPEENMYDYGASNARDANAAILRLLMNDSIEDKMPGLINYLQFGIDVSEIFYQGGHWDANGGHSSGRKPPMAFAALILEDEKMKQAVMNADTNRFSENMDIVYSEKSGVPLFAQTDSPDSIYWGQYIFGCGKVAGSKTDIDPYGYVDGGCAYYTIQHGSSWKPSSLVIHMLPGFREIWNNDFFWQYADQYIYHGRWFQPDPCAPIMGICMGGINQGSVCTYANESLCGEGICAPGKCGSGDYMGEICEYHGVRNSTYFGCGTYEEGGVVKVHLCEFNPDFWEVTYGPNPINRSECILDTDLTDGIGRFPQKDGGQKDSQGYGSFYVNTLWPMYRHVHCFNEIQDYDEEGVDCGGSCIRDIDEDGFLIAYCTSDDNYDCNDDSDEINPDAEEICVKTGEYDDNCDGIMHSSFYLDGDLDGVNDCEDNCPNDCNANQEDLDYDGIGDACDDAFDIYEDFEGRDNYLDKIGLGGLSFENISGDAGIWSWTHWDYVSDYLWINGDEPDRLIIAKEGRDEWINYTLNLIVGHKYTYSGIVLNYQDPLNYYLLRVYSNGGDLEKVEDGVLTTIVGIGDNTQLLWGGNNANYSINVIYDGSLKIDVLKDESSFRSFVDENPHVEKGSIGFAVTEGGSGNYLVIDNIEILFDNEYDGPRGVCEEVLESSSSSRSPITGFFAWVWDRF